MSNFLETLKSRFNEANVKLQLASQKLRVAQMEHQQALVEYNSWMNAVQVESRKEGLAFPIQNTQPGFPNPQTFFNAGPGGAVVSSSVMLPHPQDATVNENKTAVVREVLGRYANGLTPGELWREIQGKLRRRQYMYSVLKRMKDRGELVEKDGRYIINTSSPDGNKKEDPTSVQ